VFDARTSAPMRGDWTLTGNGKSRFTFYVLRKSKSFKRKCSLQLFWALGPEPWALLSLSPDPELTPP
jgi:hypothetical protein